jgi:hypothetical protein
MALPIEEYALIGDCKSAALVGADGSIDWLCWPRFDSAACFAALLGSPENGRWLIAPTLAPRATKRRYRKGALILETEFQSETGSAVLVDFMPPADGADLVRIVVGRSGRVDFRTEYVARFNYGASVPWVRRLFDGAISAVAGPERLLLRGQIPLSGEDLKTVGDFTVEEGQSVAFVLSYGASFQAPPNAIDPFESLERTEAFWRGWSDRCPDVGPWTEAVKRSLITLKALIARWRMPDTAGKALRAGPKPSVANQAGADGPVEPNAQQVLHALARARLHLAACHHLGIAAHPARRAEPERKFGPEIEAAPRFENVKARNAEGVALIDVDERDLGQRESERPCSSLSSSLFEEPEKEGCEPIEDRLGAEREIDRLMMLDSQIAIQIREADGERVAIEMRGKTDAGFGAEAHVARGAASDRGSKFALDD